MGFAAHELRGEMILDFNVANLRSFPEPAKAPDSAVLCKMTGFRWACSFPRTRRGGEHDGLTLLPGLARRLETLRFPQAYQAYC